MDFSDILILSDIDNTLSLGGIISDENFSALRFFTEECGGRFCVATGRSPAYIKKNYPDLSINAPIAAINGTVISDKDIILWERPLRRGFSSVIYDAYKICSDFEKVLAYRYDETISCTASFVENEEKIYKLLFVLKNENEAINLRKKLSEKYGNRYSFLRSWDKSVEVTEKDAGKGVCLAKIKKITGAKTAIAVGDYENDIPLLKSADISIAVDNAISELKQIADIVTVPCGENAIKHIICNLPDILKKTINFVTDL